MGKKKEKTKCQKIGHRAPRMVRFIWKEHLHFSSLKVLVSEILDQAQAPFDTQQIIKDLGGSVITVTKW